MGKLWVFLFLVSLFHSSPLQLVPGNSVPGLCRQNPDCRAGDVSGNPPVGGGTEAVAIKRTTFSLLIPSVKSQSQCRGSGSVPGMLAFGPPGSESGSVSRRYGSIIKQKYKKNLDSCGFATSL
jgi:hypothetical protein